MMKPLYAIADIGTNSVRLMLADGHCHPLKKFLTTTRIGESLHQTGLLSLGGMERTLDALKAYKAQADSFGIELWAFSTSAVRDALNRDEFLDMAGKTGISIHVIDGETEGMLGYLGVGAEELMTLIDIGGGSTEIAHGEAGRLLTSFSAPVGCVRALDRFKGNTDAAALLSLRSWLRDAPVTVCGRKLTLLEAAGNIQPVGKLYSVSGTATSIASIIVGATESYQPEKIHRRSFSKAQIQSTTDRLSKTPAESLCKIPVLGKRGDLIAYGGALLIECMELLGAEEITVSDSDNLEGYLHYRLDMLSKGVAAHVSSKYPDC